MTTGTIRIATRKSPLAWRQAEMVAERLQAQSRDIRVELVGMRTEGDRILDRSLAAIGGKGLFVKELEQGLLDERADIAVHSMKDVPAEFPDGLHLPVILARESPFDAFVSNDYVSPDELPEGAVIGTCSLRRASQLQFRLPHCVIRELRGNVNSRLAKLDAGEFDAIVLAVAGLERLGMEARIASAIDPGICLPAIGQGALGIECRRGDSAIESLIATLQDPLAQACVSAERAVSHSLGGSCLSPIAAHATTDGDSLSLHARVGAVNGTRLLEASAEGTRKDPIAVGRSAARSLIAQGALSLLASADAGGQ